MTDGLRIGLTLLLGPVNAGKLGRVLDWWQARLADRPVMVVPTVPDARELTFEMVRREGALINQSGAVTFDGLVRLLLARSPRYATDLERRLVLTRVLAETPLGALDGAARLPGSVKALATLFQQLEESGREPAEVDRILARWGSLEPQAAALDGDIRQLAHAFRASYAQLGLEDRPAVVREAVRAVPGSAWLRPVAFYGFTSFTPGQRAVVEALTRRTEVLVAFTFDPSREVNLTTANEITWWRARADRLEEVPSAAEKYSSAAIAYLEHYFMSDVARPEPPVACTLDSGVRFLRASGRRAEAELAAEQIMGLLRSGLRPQDIAIVVRHVAPWGHLLARVFGSCCIPYRLDDRQPLSQTGLGHAFINVIKGLSLDDSGALLAFLRSPYSGISLDRVSDLELRYRKGAVKGTTAIAALAREAGLSRIDDIWNVMRPSGGSPPGLVHLCEAAALARRMLVASAKGATAGSEEIEEDARAFGALLGALETLGRVGRQGMGRPSGEASTAVDGRTVIVSLDSVVLPGASHEESGVVQVLSAQRARARRFPVVFVLGLVEGEFPGRSDRPSLLSPSQRARLDALGNGLFAPDSDDEAALFVSAVSRASRLLFLSARNAEDDGSEATPSHLWEWARTLLDVGSSEATCRTLGDHVFSLEAAPTLRQYERTCAAAGLELGGGLDRKGRRDVPPWNCIPTALSCPAVLGELGRTQRFSPSALESYAQCPFSWFIQRVVGAEELDLELDGRCLGQLLHAVLGQTYQRLGLNGLLPLRPEGMPSAERIAEVFIRNAVNGEECPGTTAERRLAAWQLRRMVRNLFDMEVSAGWLLAPVEMETWVGSRGGVDVGGFRVNGRVDRIDATPDGRAIFVLDYKSGAIPSSAAIGREEALQLPLYLMAIIAERPRARVLGGAYLALGEKKRSGVVAAGFEELLGVAAQGCRALDEAGVDQLFETTRAVSRQAIEGMRNGVIAPRPDRDCPPWCPLGPACRARRGGFRP